MSSDHQSGKREVTPGRRLTAPLRRLPDFIIIGAQKCGTTSLYSYLRGHPSVAKAFRKEIHFFDFHYHRGASWYRAHFPSRLASYRHRLLGRPLISGEGTPFYLYYPHAARRAARTVPGVKLLVLLRNPVDRAYSNYQHTLRSGAETLAFEEALDREEERIAGEREKILQDENYHGYAYRKFSYQARGVYADQLKAWFDCFPKERILIEKTEDFNADPSRTFNRVLEFLGLPPIELPKYKKYLSGKYEPMARRTRLRLIEYFRPHNRRLQELLGVDYGWDE